MCRKIQKRLIRRMTSFSSHFKLSLLCKYACYRLLQGAAIRAATSTQQESALLILVQKLISSMGSTNTSLFEILFTTSGNRASSMQNALFASKKHAMTAQQKVYRNSTLPQQVYSASTLGILLAGQLLLREYGYSSEGGSVVTGVLGGSYNNDRYTVNGTSSSSSSSSSSGSNSTRQHVLQKIPPCSMQDRRALVNWITQCSNINKDVSALYAIDILSVCLQHAIEAHSHSSVQDDNTVEWIYYVQSALQAVSEKVTRSFGLTGRYDFYAIIFVVIVVNCASYTFNSTELHQYFIPFRHSLFTLFLSTDRATKRYPISPILTIRYWS